MKYRNSRVPRHVIGALIVIVFLLGKCSRIEEPSASTLQSMSHYRMTACGCSYPGVWFS